MTTVQIVGIVVAAAIVLLLIIALLVTRRRSSSSEEPAAVLPHESFLDDALQDTLSTLGKAEQPMEDVTIDPGVERAAHASDEDAGPVAPVAAAPESAGHGLGLDWGPSGDAKTARAAAATVRAATSPAGPADDESTGELAAATESAQPADGGSSSAPEETASESGAGSHTVPLSDIIVTTSNKMVDLQDPEVRHMLADLVRDEIDQATHYRQQGQTIDAVLQLTEAEKISRALNMRESAAAIRKMMDDLEGQV